MKAKGRKHYHLYIRKVQNVNLNKVYYKLDIIQGACVSPGFHLYLIEGGCWLAHGWQIQFLAQGPTFIQNKYGSCGGHL